MADLLPNTHHDKIPVCPCCLINHSPSNILWKGGIKAFISHSKVLCGTALPWLLYKCYWKSSVCVEEEKRGARDLPETQVFDTPIKKSRGARSMFHQNTEPAAAWSLSCCVLWFYLEDLRSYRGEAKKNPHCCIWSSPRHKKTQTTILGSESSGSLGKAKLQVLHSPHLNLALGWILRGLGYHEITQTLN